MPRPEKHISFLIALLLTLGLSGWQAARADDRLDAASGRQVEDAIRQEVQRQDLSGLAVGLVVDGELSYVKGFGFAEIESLSTVSENSRFRWASLSKPLTAVVAVREAEAGHVDLEVPIQHYLPDYRHSEKLALKLRHLLSHQGGIGHYEEIRDWPAKVRAYLGSEAYASGYSALQASNALGLGQQLLFHPGSRFLYSTFGYILAGGVLEAASGKGFEELAREQVSEPLELASLGPDRAGLPWKVKGYRKDRNQIVASENDDVRWKLPGGGFSSNIRDLARWMQALMAGPYLSEAQRRDLWREQLTSDGRHTGYGLGFGLSGSGRESRISHSGAQSQTRSLMAFYPQRRWGVVMLSNAEWADLDAIRERLEAVLIRRPD
ncbi:MAG TPA: serine hydrolase domain-containing protein [Candidatus Obscuribacterales bacterium]